MISSNHDNPLRDGIFQKQSSPNIRQAPTITLPDFPVNFRAMGFLYGLQCRKNNTQTILVKSKEKIGKIFGGSTKFLDLKIKDSITKKTCGG